MRAKTARLRPGAPSEVRAGTLCWRRIGAGSWTQQSPPYHHPWMPMPGGVLEVRVGAGPWESRQRCIRQPRTGTTPCECFSWRQFRDIVSPLGTGASSRGTEIPPCRFRCCWSTTTGWCGRRCGQGAARNSGCKSPERPRRTDAGPTPECRLPPSASSPGRTRSAPPASLWRPCDPLSRRPGRSWPAPPGKS